MAGLKEGEKKKALAASKVDTAKVVMRKDKQDELEKQKKAAEVEFQDLMTQMQTTQ